MRRAPHMRGVLYALALAVGAAALYLAFELGRYDGGYAAFDQRRESRALRRGLAAATAEAEELRRQVALLETSRDIDRKTYSEIKSSLGALEARIQAQEEELVFYRGIVAPGEGESGLRVQALEVVAQDSERRFLVTVVLAQAIVHSSDAEGDVTLRIDGLQDGQAAVLDLTELVAAAQGGEAPAGYDMTYEFRYFQGLEAMIELPVGFEPERVHVEIEPADARAEHVTRTFEWSDVIR